MGSRVEAKPEALFVVRLRLETLVVAAVNAAPWTRCAPPFGFAEGTTTAGGGRRRLRKLGSCNSGRDGIVTSLLESRGEDTQGVVVEGAKGWMGCCFGMTWNRLGRITEEWGLEIK